ncbi:PilN domain-containing protein [Patescibacteria group bacterium]|nr:PilN domain-containing protein [Patescibacteria group bacterium]MBU2472627.1 PilN domain-containing protein [Patescibacteria group bacterium]
MIKLNLLPPREKEKLELDKLNNLIFFLAVRIAIFLLIFTLLLIVTYYSLFILLKEQERLIEINENDIRIQQLVKIEEKIKNVNQHLDKIHLKQKESVVWTPILEELAKITPLGVYLSNFSYKLSINKINLSGWAESRDKLIRFKDSLEESVLFNNLESPLSNLIKKNDIDFNFTFEPAPLNEE